MGPFAGVNVVDPCNGVNAVVTVLGVPEGVGSHTGMEIFMPVSREVTFN